MNKPACVRPTRLIQNELRAANIDIEQFPHCTLWVNHASCMKYGRSGHVVEKAIQCRWVPHIANDNFDARTGYLEQGALVCILDEATHLLPVSCHGAHKVLA